MSESNLDFPQSVNLPDNRDLERKTNENISFLAEHVTKPFPLADLIKIGQLVTTLQERAETAEEMTMTDPLTGLHNRRWADENLNRVLDEARRKNLTVYLAMYDMDDFGVVNKKLGHTVGDSVLKMLSKVETRAGEDLARFGGDEFVQLISPRNEKELVLMAERNQNTLQHEAENLVSKLRSEGNTDIPNISVSMGFARFQGESPDELVKKASLAANEAKKLGKKTAVLARSLNGETRYVSLEGRPGAASESIAA